MGMNKFEKDERIVMVDCIAEIPRHRSFFSSIQGVLCPYNPLTVPERETLLDFARSHIAAHGAATISAQRFFPSFLRPAVEELEYAFSKATGFKREALLRINSTHPSSPHAHETSLTCTFSGIGTIGVNQQGQEYSVPLDHIFIFHRGIKHMASQYKSPDLPKVTLMV